MKTLALTILSLTVALLGLSIGMDKNMDKSSDMTMTTQMKSDDMKMGHDNTTTPNEAGMEQTMVKQRSYTIPDDAQLRKQLTPLQYEVTRKSGTERPFDNSYWQNHEAGIYVDIISGEPLFSSTDKYESVLMLLK